jgi:hypothetical protein
MLVHELPVAICGVDVASARVVCRRYSDMVRAAMNKMQEEWKV